MRNKPGHFIKEWRQSKNLSLRKLADRLVSDTFEPVISYASLSRIEKGEQPYSQDILEAIAEALGTSPASLLIFDPTRDSGLLTIWGSDTRSGSRNGAEGAKWVHVQPEQKRHRWLIVVS